MESWSEHAVLRLEPLRRAESPGPVGCALQSPPPDKVDLLLRNFRGQLRSGAVEPLIAALKDPNYGVQGKAFRALDEFNDPRVAGPAELLLEEIVGNYKGVIAAGQPGSEDILIAALNRFPDYGMALDFLNSGNSQLEDAVRSWASAYGYRIVEGGGGQYVGGGSAR